MTLLPHIPAVFRIFFFVSFFLLSVTSSKGERSIAAYVVIKGDSVFMVSAYEDASRPNPILTLIKARQKKNKKVTAALLAFPFPFGMVGLHRIYLGTAPYVPVVYIGTLGGALGILPFIDFCVLMLDKDIDHYIENKNVLMWVQEHSKGLK